MTFCCAVETAGCLPPARAARSACTVRITAASSARNASPSRCVHSSFASIMSSTCGNAHSDSTLASQVLSCSARSSASPVRPGFACDEARGLDDLERIRGRHQHLRQELVRIERDRGQQRVEQILRHRRGGRRGRRRLGWSAPARIPAPVSVPQRQQQRDPAEAVHDCSDRRESGGACALHRCSSACAADRQRHAFCRERTQRRRFWESPRSRRRRKCPI